MDSEKMFIGNPLIYYAISIYMGSFSYIISYDNILLGVAIATSFFIIIFTTVNRKFAYIIIVFFFLGYIFNLNYFSVNLPSSNCTLKFRILENRGRVKRAKYKGKNINLISFKKKKFKDGEMVYVKGKFKRNIDFSKGIIGEIECTEIEKLTCEKISYNSKLKEKMYKKLYPILGEENTGILMALSFGEEKYIPRYEKENLKILGVVHAISVSGFHMAVIFKILDFIPCISIKIIISFIYVIFTGAKASTLRAFIMIILLKISKLIYKTYNSLGALSFSALILISLKPFYVVNVGFVLSYLAVIGIILFGKKIKRKIYMFPKFLRESISLSISSQSLSIIYIIILFNEVSIGGILGNLLLMPLYSFLIVLGNLCLILNNLSFIFKLLSYIILCVLHIHNIIEKVLLNIIPGTIKLDYTYAIFILVLYFTYILIKKEIKDAKYIPILVLCTIILCDLIFFIYKIL